MTEVATTEQQVQTVAQSKERNYAIELWRFFFAVAITGYHIGNIFPRMYTPDALAMSNWMLGAGEILFVFTLTAGYFLVKHFKRLQQNPEYTARKASSRAWEYLWGRIKALLPVLALGILLGIISVAVYRETSFVHALYSTFNGLWEFLGLYSAGFGAAYSQSNGAMWFISGLLICSYILYWAICKSEDFTVGILAPLTFVFLGGWWAWNGTRAAQVAWSTFGEQNASNPAVIGTPVTKAVIGFNNGLLFVFLGMCGGILIYYAVEKLKTLKYNTVAKVFLTILYAAVSALLIVYTINPTWIDAPYEITNNAVGGQLSRWTVHLLCILLVGLTLLGKDYITQLLNNKYTAKVFNYLGGSALYIYMLHQPIIYFYVCIRGKHPATPYSWLEVFLVVTAVSILLGCGVKYLMDRFIIKRTPKKVSVGATAEVPAGVGATENVVPVEEPKAEEAPVEEAPKAEPKAKKASTTKTTAAKTSTAKAASTSKTAKAKSEEAPAEKPAKTAATKTTKTTTKKSK